VILQGITTQEGLEKVVQSVLTLASKNFVEDLNLLVTLCVFAIIFLVVWGVSKLRIDYARYVATTIGGVGLILGFGLASLFLEIQVDLWHLIGMTLVGIALALIAAFFRRFVNYAQAQNVQFEDENNYYYVKIVPKVVVKQSERLEKIYTTSTKEQGLSQ
jgi:mannose/fructose/N-acetylgalactosamine-specific phosphotransferase system component IIC